MRRHPPHHLSPARATHPAGQALEARLSRPSHHSNAPIKPESQSILSKIVALTPSKGSFGKSSSASTALKVRQEYPKVIGSNPIPATRQASHFMRFSEGHPSGRLSF